ncbi:hypothetical protein HY990_06015 [Candidatus Micrarchaeota archaeon]|nr:hypothetical protein [Candidatus Micrarchaeota archaeon]
MEENEQASDKPMDDRPMYDAVCTQCGQQCKVPFQPAEGRPVFCRNCYKPKPKRFGGGGGGFGGRGGGRRGGFGGGRD